MSNLPPTLPRMSYEQPVRFLSRIGPRGERIFLMLEGCDELQGYLIGRPAPIATYATRSALCMRVAIASPRIDAGAEARPRS